MKHKIAVGDPLAKRASFSRFVLPFAWEAQDVKITDPIFPRFRHAAEDDWIHSAMDADRVVNEDRCRYFTPETAELLYHRASWFVLEEEAQATATSSTNWKKFAVKSGLKDQNYTYEVALRPPAVILFEDSPYANKFSEDAKKDLLRTGFLVIEAYFPNGSQPPSFEDLLRFNEVFRYWRCPYEKHATEFCVAELNSIYNGILGTTAERDQEKNHQRLYTDRWLTLLRRPIEGRQGKRFSVMPLDWLDEDDGSGRNRQRNGDPHWLVHPDDRTFTVACAFLDGESSIPDGSPAEKGTVSWVSEVARAFEDVGSSPPSLAGHWVKLLNIDRPYSPDDDGSCSRFEYRWALERTYRRWAHDETLYGFTPHSMALMAGVRNPGYDLRLISVNEGSQIPEQGKDLMIVAQTNQKLRFCIFDKEGNIAVDKSEEDLLKRVFPPIQIEAFSDLKKELGGLWNQENLAEAAKQKIIAAVTSILDPHGEPPLGRHCGRLYFDATLLLLYLRVSLFRFSKRLHELSAHARDAEAAQEFSEWKPQFENIRWSFLLFENLYQFPLLSTQQQHVEMYELQRSCMDIRDLYQEIDKEVQSSDQVMDNKLDQQRNELASVLNTVAFIGLIGSLAIGWMQVHSDKGQTGPVWLLGLSLVFFVVFVGALLMSKKATHLMRLIAFPPLRKQSKQKPAGRRGHFKLGTDRSALWVVGGSILLGVFVWFFSPWIRPRLSELYDNGREWRNKILNIQKVTQSKPSHSTPPTVPGSK
jgi:hypothetical protein